MMVTWGGAQERRPGARALAAFCATGAARLAAISVSAFEV